MSEALGPVYHQRGTEHPFLGQTLAVDGATSDATVHTIELEVRAMLREASESRRADPPGASVRVRPPGRRVARARNHGARRARATARYHGRRGVGRVIGRSASSLEASLALLSALFLRADIVRASPAAYLDPPDRPAFGELLADETRRWQGSWVLRDVDRPGSIQAWEVHGDRVHVYDALRRDIEDDSFGLVSPCRVVRTRTLPDAGQVVSYATFAFAQDGLHAALAPENGGATHGNLVAACLGESVYLYDTASRGCRRWDAAMAGAPMEAGGECAVVQSPVVRSFVVRPFGGGDSHEVDFYGEALLSPTLLAHGAERCPSFTQARARADDLRAALAYPSR